MKHMITALGLAIVVVLSLMAISATAAQALTFRINGVPAASESFLTKIDPGALLIKDLNLEIHCNGGIGEVQLAQNGSVVESAGWLEFTECGVNAALKTCVVNTPGESAGVIIGAGEGKVVGDNVILLSSSDLTEIEIQGICAAAETEETVSGNVILSISTAATSDKTHNVVLDEDGLKFGEDEAVLHTLAGGFGGISGSMTSASEAPWSITLP